MNARDYHQYKTVAMQAVLESHARLRAQYDAVIVEGADGSLRHFNWLGYIVMAISLVALTLMYFVHKQVPEQPAH